MQYALGLALVALVVVGALFYQDIGALMTGGAPAESPDLFGGLTKSIGGAFGQASKSLGF